LGGSKFFLLLEGKEELAGSSPTLPPNLEKEIVMTRTKEQMVNATRNPGQEDSMRTREQIITDLKDELKNRSTVELLGDIGRNTLPRNLKEAVVPIALGATGAGIAIAIGSSVLAIATAAAGGTYLGLVALTSVKSKFEMNELAERMVNAVTPQTGLDLALCPIK
jgi:hypothetical protein